MLENLDFVKNPTLHKAAVDKLFKPWGPKETNELVTHIEKAIDQHPDGWVCEVARDDRHFFQELGDAFDDYSLTRHHEAVLEYSWEVAAEPQKMRLASYGWCWD